MLDEELSIVMDADGTADGLPGSSDSELDSGRAPGEFLPDDVIIDELLLSPRRVALPNIANFALTSRTWLSAARRALYRSPLSSPFVGWRAGHALLSTLRAQPNIAAFVRDLESLPARASRLGPICCSHITRSTCPLDDERGLQVWNWQRQLIAQCPALKSVGLALDSVHHARSLVATLAGRSSEISKLVLDSLSLFPIDRTSMQTFISEVHAQGVITNLDALVVRNLAWGFVGRLDEDGKYEQVPHANLTQVPSLPIHVRELALENISIPFPDLLDLLPPPATLESFSLSTAEPLDACLSTPILERFPQLLGPNLTTLSITASPYTYAYTRFDRYGRYHTGPSLPSAIFNSFPYLKLLKLSAMRNMTLNYLDNLLATSSALVTLDLRQTIWNGLSHERLADDFITSLSAWKVVGETENVWEKQETVSQRRLHLGLLPVRAEVGIATLEAAMRTRNIRFKWDGRLTASDEDEW
ncbi:hypothetical protein RQP46_008299 [Phenoliferia psychrophenolica]